MINVVVLAFVIEVMVVKRFGPTEQGNKALSEGSSSSCCSRQIRQHGVKHTEECLQEQSMSNTLCRSTKGSVISAFSFLFNEPNR